MRIILFLLILLPAVAGAEGVWFNQFPNASPDAADDEFIFWDTSAGAVRNATRQELDGLYNQSEHVTDTANPHSTSKTHVGLSYVENVKHAYAMGITPPATADSSIGYEAGKSLWLMASGEVYLCTNATVGAAVWAQVGSNALTLSETDGSPSSVFTELKLPPGSLTDNLDGTATFAEQDPGVSTHESTYSHGSFLTAETDPVYSTWDKSTGISITESQISDLSHTVDTDDQNAAEVSLSTADTADIDEDLNTVETLTAEQAINALDSRMDTQEGAGYLTGNESITLSGDASGSGTTAISVTVSDDSHAHGSGTITEADPTVAGAISTHTTADAHYTHGTAAALNVGTAIGNVVQMQDVGGLAKLPAVDGSQLTNIPGGSVTATGFNGNLATTDDTVQEVAQAFDDYLPAWTDITDMPGGFADGIDSTGLPTGIILYSDYGTFADFATACTSGVWAYADNDITLTSQTATLDCLIQFLPGTVWTDGGSNDITFAGQINAGQDQQIFEGFASGLTIGLNTPDLFLNWWGPELSAPFDDTAEINAMVAASQSGHRLWWPPDATLAISSMVEVTKSVGLYGRGSSLVTGTTNGGMMIYSPLLDSGAGEAIAVTAGDNSFTIPAAMSVSEGDTVVLSSSDVWHNPSSVAYKHGLLGRVVKIDGGKAYLDTVPPYSYTAQSFAVRDTVEGVVVDGFHVDQTAITGQDETWAILLSHVHDSVIQNCTAKGSDYAQMGFMIHGNNNRAEGNIASGFWNVRGVPSGGRGGYCFNVDGNNSQVTRNIAIDCKHLFLDGANSSDNYNIVLDNNIGYHSDKGATLIATGEHAGEYHAYAPIDFHSAVYEGIFSNNYISTSAFTGINHRGYSMKITGNTIIQRSGAADRTGGGVTSFITGGTDGLYGPLYLAGNRFISDNGSGLNLVDSSQGANTKDSGNFLSGITRVKPTCSATNEGQAFYSSLASTSTYEVCTKTGTSTYAWAQGVLPASSTSQLLIGNTSGGGWSAKSLSGVLGITTSGLTLINDGTIVEADLNVTSGTPALDLCLVSDGSTGFKWASCSGTAATAASDITVTTTNFDGIFSNSTSFDTSQELFDYLDDNSAGLTADSIDDTHIDWGTGTNQVSLEDIPSAGTANGLVYLSGSNAAVNGSYTLTTDAVNGGVALNIESDTEAQINLLGAGNGVAGAAPMINLQRANGSLASPTAVSSGDFLGAINVRGAYGSNLWDSYRTAMQIVASENWSATNQGFGWAFKSRTNGTAAGTTDRFKIQDDGEIEITDLAGSYTGGSAYVCVDNSGVLFTSESACP